MKRFLCLILLCLFTLTGCHPGHEHRNFYYLRTAYAYGSETPDGVIAPEQRNIEGHSVDMTYLISLYLTGPLEENLSIVFPKEAQLLSVTQQEGDLFITLSDVGQDFNAARFTLGCACLTLTCLELTDAEQVTITSGERSLTLTRDSLTLLDTVTENSFTTEVSP